MILRNYISNTFFDQARTYVWALVIYLCPFITLGQSSFNLDLLISQEDDLESQKSLVEAHLDQLTISVPDSLAYFYHEYANWLYDQKDRTAAYTFGKRAVQWVDSVERKDLSFLQLAYYDLAFFSRRTNRSLDAIEAYNQAIAINDTTLLAAKSYEQLGLANYRINDFKAGIRNLDVALSMALKKENDSRLLQKIYTNLVYGCLQTNDESYYRRAMPYALAADSIAELRNETLPRRYNIKLLRAGLYNQNETLDVPKAQLHYQEALEFAKVLNDSAAICEAYMGLGNSCNTTNPDLSLEFFNYAKRYAAATDSLLQYRIRFNEGYGYAEKEAYETSVEQYHDALAFLTGYRFQEKDINYDSLLVATDQKIELLRALPQVAEGYLKLYEETLNNDFLTISLKLLTHSDFLIDQLKNNSSTFQSRLFWRESSTDIYGKAIRSAYLTNQSEQAFYFMEKNKALLLIEDVATERYRRSLSLPETFVEQENDLRQKLAECMVQLNKQSTPKSIKDSLQRVRIDIENRIVRINDSLGIQEIPFDLAPKVSGIEEVQKSLKTDELFLEYHISIDDGYGAYSNNDRAYVMVLSTAKTDFFEIEQAEQLKRNVFQLLTMLRKPFRNVEDRQQYAALSNKIFLQLFPSPELQEGIRGKKLVIATDSYLSTVPFDALSRNPSQPEYLIYETEFRNLYSYSFLENTREEAQFNDSLLSMAPVEFDDPNLNSLPYSGEEVEKLKNHFKGDHLLREAATKDAFIHAVGNHGIIHLSTHANIEEGESPWIAFQDDRINLEELYLITNNAALVTLSGCNTVVGEEAVGEGLMSLARGFFYGGAQSVVASLWSVDDRSTSELMDSFYENLDRGQTKSEALHQAKIKYLETHQLSETSPYYWSSFVLLGDNAPIESTSYAWWFILLGVLALLVYYFRKKRFQRG